MADAEDSADRMGSIPPESQPVAEDRQKDMIELWLDDNWEPRFFQLRYLLMAPVIVSFLGSIVMYAVGSYETYVAGMSFLAGHYDGEHVTLPLVKALDAFLIGIILTIFSYGVYDFFVSELEPAEEAGVRPDWLKFDTVSELKNKIIEVVLVILAIMFFEMMRANVDSFDDPYMFLIIPVGTAILAVSLGFFKWSTD